MREIRLPIIFLILTLALAPVAAAEEGEESFETVIPAGNAAANQYTEAIPTARGQRDAERGSSIAAHRHSSPKQVLGDKKVRRLQSHGYAGKVTAEVAALTSPESHAPVDAAGGSVTAPAQRRSGARPKRKAQTPPLGTRSHARPVSYDEPAGNGATGEVAAAATGLGGSGALLPLAILATLIWAIAFLSRRGGARAESR